jgi:hypothetical protein
LTVHEEEAGARTPSQHGESGGTAGGPEPSGDAPTETDPELKDYGPPAEADADREPDAGSSGADEGISPWAPESYSDDPEGPTTSTEDS